MTTGIVRIVRKLPSSPNTSGRATLTKKALAAGVKSITFNERGWKFQSDIRTFRTAIVVCMKGRMGRSPIDRVKNKNSNKTSDRKWRWKGKNRVSSSVILTSRFETTQGLFWDGSRHFEPRSDDEGDT
ncbi:hypothetical protein AVEN_131444-1 [Araneus ventricosus]|uniref:Uncharacterized protein n=1 Tax=Araneus ventricosus TaxID=182803 RepID=A0A4Y2WX44_ARAVE|nr:hypothetical protein AVEN_131444-1 [Araneus ventricosus]